MSVSTEVQRTLVKSPPELWAELGNQESLARHLGEVGEIRVTKVEPESKVEWEADQASGFVQLKQSGWGTKVTLSLTRELPEVVEAAEPQVEAVAEPEPEVMAEEPEATVEPDADEPEATVEPTVEPEPEPVAAAPEPEPAAGAPEPAPKDQPAASEPTPKQGFFARLFKRRQPAPVALEPEPEQAVEPEPAVQPQAMALPEPVYPDPPPGPAEPEPSADLAAELAGLEAQMRQESTELLTGVLDRLGAAHHRPFSRG